MRHKGLLFAGVLTLAVFAGGCATAVPVGTLYTELTLPADAAGGGDTAYSKVGMATANSYFSLIATGDCSIQAAARNGSITKIKYVDYKAKNVLGIFGEYTTVVYGD